MQTKNIYQKLLSIMEEVKYIQKGDKKVAGQYKYVSHDQVASVFHPQFVKHGVMVVPSISEITQDGNRTNVILEVKFINADAPADAFAVTFAGYGIDSADKGPGKAISYAYKYALLKTFCLETGDDPDHEQEIKHVSQESLNKQKEETVYEPIPLSDPQKTWVIKKWKEAGFDDEYFAKCFGDSGVDGMLQSQLTRFNYFIKGKK